MGTRWARGRWPGWKGGRGSAKEYEVLCCECETMRSESTYVEQDPLVSIAVRAGEADQLAVAHGPVPAVLDLDLRAGGVEVGSSFRGGVRQGDDLVPEEVGARGEAFGEGEGGGIAVCCE